jgi:hypothetical protein
MALNENPEVTFLDQVEILETLQPALIIGDGVTTLGMAAEFTGIPLISLMNGYDSPYFANKNVYDKLQKPHEPYQRLREKYGLRQKHCFLEELEGELNWICDLTELFPQKELPIHYEMIGPLIEIAKAPKPSFLHKSSSIKKTVLIDLIDTDQDNWEKVLVATEIQGYNLAIRVTGQNKMLLQQRRMVGYSNTTHLFPQVDILVCNSESMAYKALYYGLPVIFKREANYQGGIIEALEHWHLGTSWDKIVNTSAGKALEYWINNKQTDAHRTIQYKVRTAFATLENKLHNNLALHFPFIEKASVILSK